MARLHEHQSKNLLSAHGIAVPKSRLAGKPSEVSAAAAEIGCPVVVKAQVWTTKRAQHGGIQFAQTGDEARKAAGNILGKKINTFVVDRVLVEEKLQIAKELYCGVVIEDQSRSPMVIFSSMGGTGIEEIVKDHPTQVAYHTVDLNEGFRDHHARNLVRKTGISGRQQVKIAGILVKLFKLARKHEARSAEINPLVVTDEDELVAADCRITVDDYSVFRQPELGIEIAREFDQPPSALDRIAYDVEKNDYRGTFYFIQLERDIQKDKGFVGFHGAGGGGSMMSMDAVMNQGFKIANFTDTSGNPPASKVYRAAKIILAQGGIDAYFGSGSGVASQEQFHSARGLVKAFREEGLNIPAVIRLGGNEEDRAVEILVNYTRDLPAPVEGYKKDDSADFCAERLRDLVDNHTVAEAPGKSARPTATNPYTFATMTGEITYDHDLCQVCESKVCISACGPEILKLDSGNPVLAITEEEAKKGKCTECLACELECEFHGQGGAAINLPIAGLSAYLDAT